MCYLKIQNTKEKVRVDDDLYNSLSKYKWYATYDKNNHIINIKTCIYNPKNRKTINKTLISMIKEHGTQLIKNNDFRRSNITTINVQKYKRPNMNGSSWYKGVYLDRNPTRYRARITINGKEKHLGSFESQHDAAKAYNDAVDLYFDGHGYKNIIGEDNRDYSRLYKK